MVGRFLFFWRLGVAFGGNATVWGARGPDSVSQPTLVIVRAIVKILQMRQNNLFLSALLPVCLFLITACSTSKVPERASDAKPLGAVEAPDYVRDVRIVLKTSRGEIEATIFATKTPVTAANFLNLAQRGYYDNLTFHRVIPDFMIQGGDPAGSGRGGPGYRFEDEFHPALRHNQGGLFSMANAGPGTNGSQFFITHNETPWLDGKHTIFGKVTKGQSVVNKIRKGDLIVSIDLLDSTKQLFLEQQGQMDQWNAVLQEQGY